MPERASPPLDGALCEALDEFTKLCIDAFPFQTSTDNDKVLQQPSTSKSSESMENCKKQAVKDEKEKAKYYHRRFRYSPYSVPKSTSKSERKADPVFTALGKIKLKGDVDKLRHCLLDRMCAAPMGCSQQAFVSASSSAPLDGDIDQLSEYFSFSVRLRLNMSALAESMYV